MKVLHFFVTASIALGMNGSAWAQAAAPAAPSVAVGTTVYGPQGGEVGKIDSVTSDTVVIDTGAHKATLPKSALGSGDKGPTITVTKAQIDEQVAAAIAQASAALDSALVSGAEVRGKAGAVVGTVKEVTGDQVVLELPSGPVSLTKKAFAAGSQGLSISLTVEELQAAAEAAARS